MSNCPTDGAVYLRDVALTLGAFVAAAPAAATHLMAADGALLVHSFSLSLHPFG